MSAPTLSEVAAAFRIGDPIRWMALSRTGQNKKIDRESHGKFKGTMNGKVLVEYVVGTRYSMTKTTTVDPARVILGSKISTEG